MDTVAPDWRVVGVTMIASTVFATVAVCQRHIGESDAAFDTGNFLGIPDPIVSVLNSPARTRPCQRLTPTLASDGP